MVRTILVQLDESEYVQVYPKYVESKMTWKEFLVGSYLKKYDNIGGVSKNDAESVADRRVQESNETRES